MTALPGVWRVMVECFRKIAVLQKQDLQPQIKILSGIEGEQDDHDAAQTFEHENASFQSLKEKHEQHATTSSQGSVSSTSPDCDDC
ncbi:hypothetical protein HBH56_114310 [Parastagonospora nodorum]|uniref:Uncharacterized protein n=2 Tax=Phaeosphaeria nodorum (strain SN15 / ATCC MYA-4574 / FGSC 10173) TaxID=321614 RepID=A0A7U2FGP7_PHANO|nr:hypothetical protein SNOG_10868 [Parastagonospora nodorum SN15]KAH3912378.1 hypothetical protein HBH56_114310 [Parastagonospora nodorum]EAT81367.1 hypothetical protein SNOG_10868 [Parastagonospora nodorum SN15]KAH3928708.1 hypothetical protein HBH54_134840 [Parastagonospora nodorum]KAH3965888.1 hypothetical protein HBH51_146630 [Parastagonospora nodorum]KAH3973776.1 hypothetical protein HBH52_136670 [Parastagonospora nodorum]